MITPKMQILRSLFKQKHLNLWANLDKLKKPQINKNHNKSTIHSRIKIRIAMLDQLSNSFQKGLILKKKTKFCSTVIKCLSINLASNNLDFQEYKVNLQCQILDIQMHKNKTKDLSCNPFWILRRFFEKGEFILKIVYCKRSPQAFKIVILL